MTDPQRRRMMQLWNAKYPSSGEDSRDVRLVFLAQVVGHPVRTSTNLTNAEAAAAIRALEGAKGKVLAFPNRTGVTKKQVWKLRQIEAYLGWADEPRRLEGYLREKCSGALCPEELGFRQAIGAIDGLLRLKARENIKRAKGEGYKVGRAELAAEVRRIQEELRAWRPGVGAAARG